MRKMWGNQSTNFSTQECQICNLSNPACQFIKFHLHQKCKCMKKKPKKGQIVNEINRI